MFPRSALPRDLSAFRHGPYPPPGPQTYNYNHGSRAAVNNFHGPGPQRLPPYEWKERPLPPAPHPVHHPYAPNMTNSRKRQNSEYSPNVVKRQRIESHPHPSLASPLPRTPPPGRPDRAVAGSSRPPFVGHNPSFPSPPNLIHPPGVDVPENFNSLQAYARDKLSCQMVEMFEACQQQASDLDRKELCRTRLQDDIQGQYPGVYEIHNHAQTSCRGPFSLGVFLTVARLYLTGSSMNGLGCRSSDADMCLIIKGNKKHDPISVLSVLQRLFKSLPYVERTQLIRAKVPILRFRERGSDLEFDLNFNNTVGIRNTFLLRSYAFADLRIRPLILVVKKWAQHNHINDASKGTLSSYTLVLLVLHYLQTLNVPVLPSLQMDYPDSFFPLMDIDMVPEGPKHVPPYISSNQSSLGELLLGFLGYYATVFSWDRKVISVREAKAFPKNNSPTWRNKFICVEEPFERNNVARAVHEKIKFDAIKAEFAVSYRILEDVQDLNSILPVREVINKESSRR